MTNVEWLVLFAVSYLFFQDEIDPILHRGYYEILLLWVNTKLFVRSYIIYRKLKQDMERTGLPVPPFRFIPIQKRS